MRQEQDTAAAGVVPARDDLEQFTSYEDGDDLVVCDRQNPAAWVRSDATESVRP